MRGLSYVQRGVLAELQVKPRQSYDSLAGAIGADRRTVIVAVRRLVHHNIVAVRGGAKKGRTNCYDVLI
jgi:DNA-binding Lrp family transcriptional regulator